MMTPEHASTLELIRELHALDPSAAEIVVGEVAIRFNRLPAMPADAVDAEAMAELKVENALLREQLGNASAESLY